MKDNITFFGYLGLLASIMVGIGEFLIHFAPGGFGSPTPYAYLLLVPEKTLTIGHYIIIPFISLYVLGYYHIYLALKSGNNILAKAVLTLGIFAFMIGGIWVGSRAHLGITLKHLQDINLADLQTKILASYNLHMENLVQILRVLILSLSILFVWAILKGKTLYPKWMVLFNPVLLLAIVFALFFFIRPIGQFLVPTAMNVAHLILFSASLIAIKKSKTT